jgi:predicted esterase
MTTRLLAAIPLLVLALGACKREEKKPPPPVATLPPLAAPASITALPIKGFGDAIVSAPAGATRPMPVVIAVLGIGDTPEEQCAAWRDIVTAPRAFVICPRGAPNMVRDDDDDDDVKPPATTATNPEATEGGGDAAAATPVASASATTPPPTKKPKDKDNDDNMSFAVSPNDTADVIGALPPSKSGAPAKVRQVGFLPVDLPSLDREVTAALAALKTKYGAHVSDKEIVYAGFSRGAFLGASLAAKYPQRFTRVVLIEGGQSAWQATSASTFAKGGGKRILFACGRSVCVEESNAATGILKGQKVDTRVVASSTSVGHTYKKQVKEDIRRSFDWVTEGDDQWKQILAR